MALRVLSMDGGLNLNDPAAIADSELAIALNADFRNKGTVRSRDGKDTIYSSQGTDLIGSADGDVYSLGTDVYRNGAALSASVTGASAIGVTKLRNVQNEVLLFSAQANFKVDDNSVQAWGIVAPTVAPTGVVGAGGSLNVGNYYFKYTYVRKSGTTIIHESNPSPVSLVQTTSGGNLQVALTCTASSDTQVTHIRIYRTLVGGAPGGSSFYYDQEITGTTATSSQADTALGALVETDNDPPPSTGLTSIAGPGAYGCIFIASGNKVYFSKPNKPESFPSTYYVEVGVPYQTVQAIIDWAGLIFAFTKAEVYFLQGTDPDTFYPVRTMASRGLVARKAIYATEKGILYGAYDGVYAFNGQAESKITSKNVDSLFRGETVNDVSPINKTSIANCWLVYFNGKVFFGYPTGSNTYPDKVLVYDFETFKFSIYDYGINIVSVFVDNVNYRLLAGSTTGEIWRLEVGDRDTDASFNFKVRSKELSLLDQVSPTFARHDITNAGANTVYTRLLSKGVVKNTIIITDSEQHKRRVLTPQHLDSIQFEVECLVASRVQIGAIGLE